MGSTSLRSSFKMFTSSRFAGQFMGLSTYLPFRMAGQMTKRIVNGLRKFVFKPIASNRLFRLMFILLIAFFLFLIVRYLIKLQPYDLMKDALAKQNISRHTITCKSIYLTFNHLLVMEGGTKTYKQQLERSRLLKDYYIRRARNSFEIDQPIFVPIELGAEIGPLQFCSLNKIEHFFAASVVGDGEFDVRADLDSKYYKLMNLSGTIRQGGYWEPPYCLQDYLYYSYSRQRNLNNMSQALLSKRALQTIKRRIVEYNQEVKTSIDQTAFNKTVLEISHAVAPALAKLTDFEPFVNSRNSLTLIVIPYMNREDNLRDLLFNLHSFLQRQFIQYQVLVVEQVNSNEPFNKGRLYNAAFHYIQENYMTQYDDYLDEFPSITSEKVKLKRKRIKKHLGAHLKVTCIILHDVDLIPESDDNVYECDDLSPRHLSVAIRRDSSKPHLAPYVTSSYELLIGGVLAIKPHLFRLINGFSNEYWEWGAEDDDLAMRMIAKGICVIRPSETSALYKMSRHNESKKNPVRETLLFSSVSRMKSDGLSNLHELNVRIIDVKFYNLFTHLKVFVSKRTSDYYQKYSTKLI